MPLLLSNHGINTLVEHYTPNNRNNNNNNNYNDINNNNSNNDDDHFDIVFNNLQIIWINLQYFVNSIVRQSLKPLRFSLIFILAFNFFPFKAAQVEQQKPVQQQPQQQQQQQHQQAYPSTSQVCKSLFSGKERCCDEERIPLLKATQQMRRYDGSEANEVCPPVCQQDAPQSQQIHQHHHQQNHYYDQQQHYHHHYHQLHRHYYFHSDQLKAQLTKSQQERCETNELGEYVVKMPAENDEDKDESRYETILFVANDSNFLQKAKGSGPILMLPKKQQNSYGLVPGSPLEPDSDTEIDWTSIRTDSVSHETVSPESPESPPAVRPALRRKSCPLPLLSIILIAITGLIVASYLLLIDSRVPRMGFKLDLISYEIWCRMPRPWPTDIAFDRGQVPNNVLITHTGTEGCFDPDHCLRALFDLQSQPTMYQNIQRIFNFLIGGDGQTYEVRGWDFMSGLNLKSRPTNLVFGFLGNFTDIKPNAVQLNSARSLIEESIRRKRLSTDYHIYGLRNVTTEIREANALFHTIAKWPKFVDFMNIS